MISLRSFITSYHSQKPENMAYVFSFTSLHGGKALSLKDFEGKVIVIVNTASHCGLTPQYKELEDLYKTYKNQGLVVIGVPSNDFGNQEPGTHETIEQFCQINYGVTFPMTTKEQVVGNKAHPFYMWAKALLGWGTAPMWNFHKYLINRRGELVEYYYPITSTKSKRFQKKLLELLKDRP